MPIDMVKRIVELKEQSMKMKPPSNNDEYQADPYSEEAWLKKFGVKIDE